MEDGNYPALNTALDRPKCNDPGKERNKRIFVRLSGRATPEFPRRV
jgi:hypothetical protein